MSDASGPGPGPTEAHTGTSEPTSEPTPEPTPESSLERRIREALERGDFDHLPGAGRPITGLDQPYSAERWAVDRARAEGGDAGALLSPMLALRREREYFLATIAESPTEHAVRETVRHFNVELLDELRRCMDKQLIPVGLIDEDEAVAAWRATRPDTSGADPTPEGAVPHPHWWHRGRSSSVSQP